MLLEQGFLEAEMSLDRQDQLIEQTVCPLVERFAQFGDGAMTEVQQLPVLLVERWVADGYQRGRIEGGGLHRATIDQSRMAYEQYARCGARPA